MEMKKFIVTTTINEPTEATLKFRDIAHRDGWNMIVVGDKKTPHESYEKLNHIGRSWSFQYLTPERQDYEYLKLSYLIGWGSIQRRNVGLIEAYRQGADVVATVDDDNIPYDDWGTDLYVGQAIEVDIYEPEADVFDPLSVTEHSHLWHRGYPVDLLPERHKLQYKGKQKRRVLVQADLWDGDPDIDAMARLIYKPCVKFNDVKPYGSNKISPFNSQNTFLAREVLPVYACLPHVGRMDDIWGGYLMQMYYPDSVIYNRASVYQDRNPQDLITNLQNEIKGYRETKDFIGDIGAFYNRLPEKTKKFWIAYTSEYGRVTL
jgi:hypothetical protein